MKKILIATAICTALSSGSLLAQTLFTYGKKAVGKEEFLKMYNKNNIQKKPDMSLKALQEYVTLYSRYKMKVDEAKLLKMDTLPSIKAEYESYRKQLVKGYLNDKKVMGNLAKETYDRLQYDVEIAHILITTNPRIENDVTKLKLIDSIYNSIESKKLSFENAAKAFSEDKRTAEQGGYLGYFTALMYPYPIENVAYTTPIGKVAKAVKTNFGYHIVKVINKRPAKGELRLSQILINVKPSETPEGKIALKAKADSIYKALKTGASWSEMAKLYNDDKHKLNDDGDIPKIGVGLTVPAFENAAYALNKPGDICQPIETNFGFHIIKLNEKVKLPSFENYKDELQKKIERDERNTIAKKAYTESLKTKNKLVENPAALTNLISSIPDTAMKNGSTYLPTNLKGLDQTLFTLDGKAVKQADFYGYILNTTRGRLYGTKDVAIPSIYNTFLEQKLVETEEQKLEKENKDYASLLDEYKSGIMIFELTTNNIWNKAAIDTVGLEKYYNENKAAYMWGPSFEGKLIRSTDEASMKTFLEAAKNKSLDDAMYAVNDSTKNIITVEEGKFDLEKYTSNVQSVQANQYSKYTKTSDNQYVCIYPSKIYLQPTQKTLAEAKGFVIGNYQEYLEKKWYADLEKKYPVKVNQAVLQSMVK